MKKLIGITGIILISCVVISVVFAPQMSAESTVESNVNSATNQYERADGNNSKEIYIIKAENDEIVVYEQGQELPLITKKISISSLPKGDILRLKDGIVIIGREKLRRALEDYCS